MNSKEVRWMQRFSNYEKAYRQLGDALETVPDPSDLEKEGIIQRFAFTHELAWKVMKDFLTERGIKDIFGSKDAVKHAFSNNLIKDGVKWMWMIESRNQTVHTYNPEILKLEYSKIKTEYFPQFTEFYETMKNYL